MDDVKVNYNSDKPAQLQALAYAQGTDIHVAPGQEQHLPHEAWHVVQQKQGRVQPTMQMKDVAINDDAGLERETDVMGTRGWIEGAIAEPSVAPTLESGVLQARVAWGAVVQRGTGGSKGERSGGIEQMQEATLPVEQIKDLVQHARYRH